MSPGFAEWLALREAADAAARSADLLPALRAALPPAGGGPLVVHDLGCGTGSMGRWLAPALVGPQHWVLRDRDPGLLDRARADLPRAGGGGAPVTVEVRAGDLTHLRPADLASADLVTASALLDLLTAAEVAALAEVCVAAGCPVLWSLSVVGRVELDPSDPLDGAIAAAFDAHQRRADGGGRRLLGPDAPAAAAAEFRRRGARVTTRSSPWRLGPGDAALTAEWLRGWVAAAVEQRPDLAPAAGAYLRDRLDLCARGGLRVVVHHSDLLVLPAPGGAAGRAPAARTRASAVAAVEGTAAVEVEATVGGAPEPAAGAPASGLAEGAPRAVLPEAPGTAETRLQWAASTSAPSAAEGVRANAAGAESPGTAGARVQTAAGTVTPRLPENGSRTAGTAARSTTGHARKAATAGAARAAGAANTSHPDGREAPDAGPPTAAGTATPGTAEGAWRAARAEAPRAVGSAGAPETTTPDSAGPADTPGPADGEVPCAVGARTPGAAETVPRTVRAGVSGMPEGDPEAAKAGTLGAAGSAVSADADVRETPGAGGSGTAEGVPGP
ncbi:methyltransferase domain-containing protein [Streptomonospora nanhaiensis]|uniref:methyltransferase domain-containing protein n=1 Tax=Streptomonospora nanhaiensis TaxID=1323731 RepID=UPI0027E38241|nr:methyltransferase domain-containing protein [Streptomonospora nanhaiensis]